MGYDMNDEVLYLDAAQVSKCLESIDPVEITRQAHMMHALGRTELPLESYMRWSTPSGSTARSLSMPAAILGEHIDIGVKIINASLSNTSNSIARANGVTMLFESETGRVKTIMDAGKISSVRTAATSILSFRALPKRRDTTLSIIGAGVLGSAHIDVAVHALARLSQILIHDQVASKAQRLVDERSYECAQRDVSLDVSTDLHRTVSSADYLVTATTATEPYIDARWLDREVCVSNVSLDDLPPEAYIRAQHLLVDDWDLVTADRNRLLGKMHRHHQIGGPGESPEGYRRMVNATLGEVLLAQSAGSKDLLSAPPAGAVIFNPFGVAISDIALATQVDRVARASCSGRRLKR